jgi:hypothetical protein
MSFPELMSQTLSRLSSLPDTILCLSNCTWIAAHAISHKTSIHAGRRMEEMGWDGRSIPEDTTLGQCDF